MNQIIVAFVTGLTTGGLSCLAVQGGLLASSLAHQLEQDVLNQPSVRRKKYGRKVSQPRPQTALPIALFLGAKVVAYTLLGFLLGLLGSVLTLNATVRAILFIAIGIFMVGNALRMLNTSTRFSAILSSSRPSSSPVISVAQPRTALKLITDMYSEF